MADDTPQDSTPPATPATGDTLGDGGKAALEAERAARKEAEKTLKALQRELEQSKAASMSETEKAIAEAEKRGEANALGRVGQRLVDAELRVATQGRALTPDALLTFDRSKFLTADGDVDREGLGKWVEQVSVAPTPEPRRFGDVGQGPRTPSPSTADGDGLATARALFGGPS